MISCLGMTGTMNRCRGSHRSQLWGSISDTVGKGDDDDERPLDVIVGGGTSVNSYRCNSSEITILDSNKARYCPKQLRGPAMNARKVNG
jgi:hypothetical protein